MQQSKSYKVKIPRSLTDLQLLHGILFLYFITQFQNILAILLDCIFPNEYKIFRSEEPTSTNMDISTGHMVLAYMEDHLKNKQRLEQEWVALCGYEAEPCATTIAFKVNSVVRQRNILKK